VISIGQSWPSHTSYWHMWRLRCSSYRFSCLCRWWPAGKRAENEPARARGSLWRLQQHNWIVPWDGGVQRNYEGWRVDRCCVLPSVLVHYWMNYVELYF
jgi:hypothetical protein